MAEIFNDPYSRANYRSLIAWPERLRREAPFLASILADAPDRSVADLGCGTGEHTRHLAEQGFRAAGLDASESMIADARTPAPPANATFTLGDIRDADTLLGADFGAAICLGNMLPSLRRDEDLDAALAAVFRTLLPGGVFLSQILNYEGLRARKARHLPINFQRTGDGIGEPASETVFLRLLEWRDGGEVIFFPTTLRLTPDSESPVEVVRTRRVPLRAWTRMEILAALARAGFGETQMFGGMERSAYRPLESSDLVVVARKPAR
ncbi:MAG: class I SAM-dependent methyltransferase [bacterium]